MVTKRFVFVRYQVEDTTVLGAMTEYEWLKLPRLGRMRNRVGILVHSLAETPDQTRDKTQEFC